MVLIIAGSSYATAMSSTEVDVNDDLICKNIVDSWIQVNEDGFGSKFNRGPRGIEIFNNSLVVGTANYNSDTIMEENKSFRVSEFIKLYYKYINPKNIPSDGCEIWCVNDDGVEVLVGPNGKNPSGFGDINNKEVGMIIKFKGHLYAGIRNVHEGCQVWRTKSINDSWEKVADNGFGNQKNSWCMAAIVYNDELYIGTFNYFGCEIFKTSDGENWVELLGKNTKPGSGFGSVNNFYAWSMAVYDSSLYVGTNNLNGGFELWKTSDGGATWDPVIAYDTWIKAKLHGADAPRGFTRRHAVDVFTGMFMKTNIRGGVRNMAVYKDELYLGIVGEDLYGDVEIDGIGKLLTFTQGFPKLFYPLQRRKTMGLEIFKYNATEDKWTPVVTGINKGNFSAGFGDRHNEYPWSMTVHNGYFYVGTLRSDPGRFTLYRKGLLKWNMSWAMATGGGELWRYDGTNWEQINQDGFGDITITLVFVKCLFTITACMLAQ